MSSYWNCTSCGLSNPDKRNKCQACFTPHNEVTDNKTVEEENKETNVTIDNQEIVSQNMVLTFGKNNKLQTGHMINNNIFTPQILQFKKSTNAVYIAAGFDHSGIIDSNGNVTLWGDNTYKQISPNNNQQCLKPYYVSLSINIKQIALSSNASLFLDEKGQIWSIGTVTNSNKYKDVSLIKFNKENNNEYISSICSGYQHFGAISNYNQIYVWGNNKYGQLGLGNNAYNYVSKPQLIKFKDKIIKCKMGRWHSLILTHNGYVYSCGWGRFGVLGLNDYNNRNIFEHVSVRNKRNNKELLVDDIKCGAVHNCCIIRGDKSCYIWGRGKYGRLGLGNEQNMLIPTLLRVKFVKNNDGIDAISLGGDDGFIISLFGDIYVWGKAIEGQLGFHNTNKNVLTPKRLSLDNKVINNYKPIDVVLGDCHSIILMEKHNMKC